MVDRTAKLYKGGMKAGTAFFSRQNEEIEYLLSRNITNVGSTRGIQGLYGLVDFQFNTVNMMGNYQDGLSSGHLVMTNNSTNPVFVTKFVHDAFDAMAIYYGVAKNHNKIKTNVGSLVDLKIKRGYESINNTHEAYMQTYFESFTGYLNSRGLIEKIANFNEFMKHFEDFLYQVVMENPITRTGFTRSVYSNILNGGLAIEIENISKSKENRKVSDFYENPNFDNFSKTAEHFGFVIDRDVPWRLIANISSPRMQIFMEQHGITKLGLFDDRYIRTVLLDINILIKHAATFYNTYVAREPETTRPELVFNENCPKRGSYIGSISSGTLKIKKFRRTTVSKNKAIADYGIKQWVKLYFRLRLTEEKIDISTAETNALLTSIYARSLKNNSIDLVVGAVYSDLEVKRRITVEV